ncbi:methyl-accepting chemotaxis protein [Paenibacillus flagellatus]|uniref:Chemotaxis protein n=1 Tax=Paenibacillus flagellatus TaxID=2211139 RepID=A0A2V5KPB9_9BACL|nr:methyl-accepting chemotaxis protein [Paenibacillus flagellatus]PYI52997.1 chemotaxis protein [Paenibacillus flagellatus]
MNPNVQRPRFKIRHKLIAVLLLLLALPTLVVGLVSYNVSKSETDKLIESKLQSNVRLAVEMVGLMDASVQSGAMTAEAAQEKVKSMLIGEKGQDGKRPINPNIDIGPNGYFFIMDAKGTLLGHPLLEGQNIWDKRTSDGYLYIQDMIAKAQAGGGNTYYLWPLPNSDKEAMKITYAELDPKWNWVIAAGSYMMDYNAGQKHILSVLTLTLAGCLAVGAVVSWLFAQHISKPIARVAARTRRIAEGDLSADALDVRNRDEIGQLAADFTIMNDHLQSLVVHVQAGAEHVLASSQELSSSIDETTKASRDIAASVQHIATGMETQSVSTRESSRAMEEMAVGISRIAATSSSAFDASVHTSEAAEEGYRFMQKSVEQMNRVSSTVAELADVIQKLDRRSKEIGEIVQVMTGIASQTSLLALNASIEAARAGEQGRGFMIVAGEVKKLAVQSESSAQEVIALVDAIQADIGYAVRSMTKGENEVREGVALSRETGESFKRILDATRSVVEHIQEASSSAEQMSASSEQVAASLQEMARITETGASGTQTILASSEEQLATMEQLAVQADQLSRLAERLQDAVAKFRT